MEQAIMKVLCAYISRNETCFVNDFEFISEVDKDLYKVGTLEIDKTGNEFKVTYYVTLGNHGLKIEEIM
jgi:hypothetical protein